MSFRPMSIMSVNLQEPESRRWSQVIRARRRGARILLDAVMRGAEDAGLSAWALRLVVQATWAAYRAAGGRWVDEMIAWSVANDVDAALTGFANCSYEVSQAREHVSWRWGQFTRRVLGCTAGILDDPAGPIHVRSLDWPLAELGRHSMLVRFHDGKREFLAATAPGFVGVLTGMVPGRYSVSINYAPPAERPSPTGWGPAFLVRSVLEEIDEFDAAVAELSSASLASPVFFVVCGARCGEGVVVERTRADAVVRPLRDRVLVQANHHVARRLSTCNEPFEVDDGDGTVLASSRERSAALALALRRMPRAADLARTARALDVVPVLNEDTCQQVVMRPATGEVLAWMG